jgi:hypothetical protein
MEKINKLIEKYTNSLKTIDSKMIQLKKENQSARKKYTIKNKIYSNSIFILKPFYYLDFYNSDRSYKETDDIYVSYKSKLKELKNNELHELIVSTGRLYMEDHPEINNELIDWENEHNQLLSLLLSSTKISKLTKKTRSEITYALKGITDAKMSEYGDIVFSDNLSSAQSTSTNFDASYSVFKAERTLKTLNKLLAKKKTFNDSHYNFHRIEQMDQNCDYFLGGIFDSAGSIMSLKALDRTERELEATLRKISKFDNEMSIKLMELRKSIKNYEYKMLDFKNTQREKIIPLLNKYGINIKKKEILNVKNLYAK